MVCTLACSWFVNTLTFCVLPWCPNSFHKITLRDQGTPEQHELFLRKAENYEFIGCYAQTELGHGSNVRGLETTATWNSNDKNFTLHSPHLTASKWWIGSMGRTANHAVVMAQLMIDGKSYGPHPFVVQIRDMKTHEPLENIHVGDIGPKFGCVFSEPFLPDPFCNLSSKTCCRSQILPGHVSRFRVGPSRRIC